MNVDTETLRWFQQVADGVTVTEVSQVEGVSQPGVSRALARLEAEVGTPLLQRSGRLLRMTHAGFAFKRHVDALLHQLDDGLAAINQIIDPDSGTVALAFQVSLGAWLVPDLVGSFREHHPLVGFDLIQVHDEAPATVLDDKGADLVITSVPSLDRAVGRQPLIDEPLRLAVAATHPLARKPTVRLADAAAEPFLMIQPPSMFRRQCDRMCEQAGFTPTISFEGEDLHTLRGFVAAGLGVAIVPASGEASAQATAGNLRYLSITDVRATRQIGLVWSVDRRLPTPATRFRDHVVARAVTGRLPAIARHQDAAAT